MCILSDCVVRIETGLWVIRFHYLAYVPVMLLSIWLLWSGPRDHSPWATGVACRGHWPASPLGTSSAHCTVHSLPYRLRHSLIDQDRCPTARTAARTDRVDLSNTYRVIVLVTGGSTVGHPSVQLGFLFVLPNILKFSKHRIRLSNFCNYIFLTSKLGCTKH